VQIVEPVLTLEVQNAESSGITQLPTDMSMTPDSLHLPSGFEGIQATIHPTSRKLAGIEDLLDRDFNVEVSELSGLNLPKLHSPTYKQNMQSSDLQTGIRTQDMQSVEIASNFAVHGGQLTETSSEEVLGTSPVSDQIEQTLNPQTLELNENFQFAPSQLNFSFIDEIHPLLHLQTYDSLTHDQDIYLGNIIEGYTEAENFHFSDSENTSAVIGSHSDLLGISAQSTQENLTSNEQFADVTYSSPTSSQPKATNSSAFTQHYGKSSIYS